MLRERKIIDKYEKSKKSFLIDRIDIAQHLIGIRFSKVAKVILRAS
jgi:hypothetical protein